MSGPATRCLGVRRHVRDLAGSRDFYVTLFGFAPIPESNDEADLALGDMRLELRPANGNAHRPPRSHDRSFRHLAIVVRDMQEAAARLDAHGVAQISEAPQTLPDWNPQASGIEALYFRDPDGHPLELIRFPSRKGKPIWHRPGPDLFLGVDHTAIVVADLAVSVPFYASLGFTLEATAHNCGREQAALSGVSGASLHVATMGAGDGSLSLELLAYIEPIDGRAQPDGLEPGDLGWSETLIAAPHAKAEAPTVLRDPDGHGVSLR